MKMVKEIVNTTYEVEGYMFDTKNEAEKFEKFLGQFKKQIICMEFETHVSACHKVFSQNRSIQLSGAHSRSMYGDLT